MILERDDEGHLVSYLDASPDETVWLRSAWREGGARFAARRRDRRIVGIAAHDARGVVHVHGGAPPDVVRACVRQGEPIIALAGPPGVVEEARAALDLLERRVARTSHEIIMGLDLAALVVPPILSSKRVVCRPARADELPLVVEWRRHYLREVHAADADSDDLDEVLRHQQQGLLFVLEDDGVVVNTVSLSAVFPRLAQLEYAYSPPELRSRGYGRSAGAGALLAARARGVERGVLYTAEHNLATQAAVYHLGFRRTGRFRVLIFARG